MSAAMFPTYRIDPYDLRVGDEILALGDVFAVTLVRTLTTDDRRNGLPIYDLARVDGSMLKAVAFAEPVILLSREENASVCT